MHTIRCISTICLSFVVLCAPQVYAQDATPPPRKNSCSEPEYRQLDFWLGEWDLTWTQADGTSGSGTNSITLEPFGTCVITEKFNGHPTMNLKGMSLSTWHTPSKLWRQTWVDNQGGYFSLYGGPDSDGAFTLDMERPGDRGPFKRMIWDDMTDDSLTWRWQGKSSIEEPWTDQWVIYYVRRTH